MLAQAILAVALIGQCGSCGGGMMYGGPMYSGPMYSGECGMWAGMGGPYGGRVYAGPGMYVYDAPAASSGCSTGACGINGGQTYRQGALVGSSVLCYYRNTGGIRTKSYAKARIWIGGKSGLVNVPIVNGCAPSIQWTRNESGMIVSLVCDYQQQIPYDGNTLIYGKAATACQPATEKQAAAKENTPPTPKPETLLPVPSQETTPIPPMGDDAPPQSSPLKTRIERQFPDVKVEIEPPKPQVLAPVPSK